MVVTPLVKHVLDTSPAEGPTYFVHLTLALLADDDAHVRVSQGELARMARVSVGTMRRGVRELLDQGLVVQVEPPNQRIPALLRVDGMAPRGTREAPLSAAQGVRSGTSKRRQRYLSGTSNANPLLALDLETQPTTDVVGSAVPAEPGITGRGIAGRIWKLKNPRPAQPFMAIVKIAEALLDAGNDPCAVERAMLVVPTISTRSVEFELNRKPTTRTQPAVDTEREAAGGIVQL